ncbi:effector-associated domain EAD1-containing protein [Bradyrhizobium sp.]
MSEAPIKTPARLSKDDIDAWLADAEEDGNFRADKTVEPVLAAAAVLSSFDPSLIRTVGGALPETNAINMLLESSKPLHGPGERRLWQLDDKNRQIALEHLGTRKKLREARAANPSPAADPLQKGIDLLLESDSGPALTGLSLSSLLGLQRASRWLGTIPGIRLPDERQLLQLIERERMLQPMRKLIANGFVGRKDELAILRNYVGVLPPDRMSDYFRRAYNHVRYLMETRPPLLLHGPGGVGKSTLLAQFIVEHADPGAQYPMPFIYLDFDRASLDPVRPHTLLTEAVAQIQAQFPGIAERADGAAARELDSGFESMDIAKGEQFGRREALLARVSSLLEQLAGVNGQPVLLVLDTFEEAQIQGDTAVISVWSLLRQLLERVDRLRIVVAGRRAMSERMGQDCKHEPHEIKSFDRETALDFLQKRAKDSAGDQLPSADARAIFDLIKVPQGDGSVGAVPLSLALAARIVLQEGLGALKQIVSRRALFTRITAEEQQGLLNTRIMQHLHSGDTELDKIADPGLLVRRITPDVIRYVLAGPCGVTLGGDDDAKRLFEGLAKEVALVDTEKEQGALWHLPAVRRTMLAALRRKTGEEILRAIHDNAVEHYGKVDSDTGRAEELYHRMCRGDPTDILESRWRAGLEPALRGAYEELEGQPKLWLAGKLNLEVDEGLRALANLADWEKQAELRARTLFNSGLVVEALAAIRERTERSSASMLPALEADALLLLQRPAEARDILLAALQRDISSGREDIDAALLIRLSTVEERQDRLRDALQAAEEALLAARTAGDAISALGAGAAVLRLRRKLQESDLPKTRALRRDMLVVLENSALRRQLRSRPAVLRELAAELASDQPELVADALEIVGLDREALGGTLASLYESVERATNGTGELFERVRKLAGREARVDPAGAGRELAVLIRSGKADPGLLEALGRSLSATVERSTNQVVASEKSGAISLSREEKQHLRALMLESLNSKTLEELVYLGLDAKLETIIPLDAPFGVQVSRLIDAYEQRGAMDQLLNALARSSTSSSSLRSLAASLLRGRGPGAAALGIDLNDLNGLQRRVLRESIMQSFGPNELEMFTSEELDQSIPELKMDMPFERVVFHLIERAQKEAWTDNLIKALQERRPHHPRIQNLISELRLLEIEGDRRLANRSLERTVRGGGFADIAEWSSRLGRIRGAVCRLENETGALATAFLVGPDLVLTTFHAVQHNRDHRNSSTLTCRFDFVIESGGVQSGIAVPVADENWLLAYSPPGEGDTSNSGPLPLPNELDYALLRLAEPVGNGPSPAGDGKRGWLALRDHLETPAAKDTISIVQHADGKPLTIALGTVIGLNVNATRLRYDTDTLPGSGGSPCFDARLELVAMHQASYPGVFKQGIPVDKIVADLSRQPNVPRFWIEQA